MTSRCRSCGREQRFRATRGSRLADLRCQCGGELFVPQSRHPRPAYEARVVYVNRNGGARRRYFVSVERATKDIEESRPYYQNVMVEKKVGSKWVPA